MQQDRYLKFFFGIILIFTIIFQWFYIKESPINYFSYFTILSNLLAGIIFILLFFKPISDFWRGFVVLCMTITSLGFIVLLRGNNDSLLPGISLLFHYIAPMLVVIDWLLIPSQKITIKQIALWLLFLLFYLLYSLIRGFVTHWYPYNFLDETNVGVHGVIIYTGILLVTSIVLSWILSQTGGKLYFLLKKTN